MSKRRKKKPMVATYTPAPASQQHPVGLPFTPDPAVTAGNSILSDPGYQAATAAGQRNNSLADAQYDFTTSQARSDYGFDANGNIDPNNPYSRAALLQETARRARVGSTNSYASQGQLYSGALQNAQDENTRQYNIGFDQLQKGYTGVVGQAALDRTGSYNQSADDIANATALALANLLKGGSS